MAVASLLSSPVVLIIAIVLIGVRCDDDGEKLLDGINKYRVRINLSPLKENPNADCLAGEIAAQFKGQVCTNTTGSDTVPGTEPQFSDYPTLLEKCHLNITGTREGSVMPACVPGLDPDLVLTNFTLSHYSANLNTSSFTGAGAASDRDWIVLILTTDTPGGSFAAVSRGLRIYPFFLLFFICSLLSL